MAEEDWAANAPSSNGVGALQSKLRGFGRGGGFQELRSQAQASPASRTFQNGGDYTGSAASQSGNGVAEDGWNDDPPPVATASRFGKKEGGFGSSDSFGKKEGGFGRACFKCGESGHMSRECPQGGGRSDGQGQGCRKCGQDGHFARDCPNGGGGGGGCHKCGEEGHFARDCPKGDNSGCRKCGEEGHFARDCPKGDNSGCRKCGEEGHFARDCPKEGGEGGRSKGCHRCGQEGHFVRECPQPPPEGEKPRELYIPPEVDESLLFTSTISQGINFDKYDCIEVLVTGSDRPQPVASFQASGLLPSLLANVQRSGYSRPTPIQKHAIPAVLARRDLMACAQTGSGKTAAFLLPVLCGMITRGLESSQFSLEKTPQVVVVAPTRELATQIQWEAAKFSKGTDVQTAVVYGGTDRRHQRTRLLKGANLVVGTPGRLLDFIRDSTISLAKVQYLILDEADRMLDLGFEPDIRKLVETFGMPPKGQRQTLMFSATFKEEIQRLAGDFLQDYLFITVGIVGGACADVTQTFLQVDQFQKREHLCQILNEMGTQKVLVFVGQKRNADFLASFLSQSGYPTTSIHGDRLQREREEALRAFREGKSSILIATNVAARGLDIPEVAHVINYDMPADIDEYVHRIGRTGRCGNLGHATSFYNPDTDHAMVGHLVRILGEANQEVPDWLADYANTAGAGGGGRGTGRFASKDIRRPKFRAGGDDSGYGDAGGDVVCDEECWD